MAHCESPLCGSHPLGQSESTSFDWGLKHIGDVGPNHPKSTLRILVGNDYGFGSCCMVQAPNCETYIIDLHTYPDWHGQISQKRRHPNANSFEGCRQQIHTLETSIPSMPTIAWLECSGDHIMSYTLLRWRKVLHHLHLSDHSVVRLLVLKTKIKTGTSIFKMKHCQEIQQLQILFTLPSISFRQKI